MKSSDLKYIYDNKPHSEMNKYPMGIQRNTILQYIDFLQENDYKYYVKKLKKGHRSITLKREDGSNIDVLKNPVYPTNSKVGRKIAIDKFKSEQLLKKADLLTTNSMLFNMNEKEAAKEAAFKDGEPEKGIVIKPLDLSLGKGVFVNVTKENFEAHWEQCVKIMKANGRTEDDGLILVQDFMDGFEVRATVLEGHLISVVARVPAFVIGDGSKTINELIDEKNEMRSSCGFLSKNLIKKSDAVTAFISNEGYTLDSVPEKDKYVLLLSVSNTSFGGEVMELTESVTEETRELALNAVAALPDMTCSGVDIMIRDFEDKNPRVIEINPFPVLGLTTYPTYGKPQNPFKYFIEAFYTKDKLLNNLDLGAGSAAESTKFFGLIKSTRKQSAAGKVDTEMYIRNYFKFYERQHEMIRRQYTNSNKDYLNS